MVILRKVTPHDVDTLIARLDPLDAEECRVMTLGMDAAEVIRESVARSDAAYAVEADGVLCAVIGTGRFGRHGPLSDWMGLWMLTTVDFGRRKIAVVKHFRSVIEAVCRTMPEYVKHVDVLVWEGRHRVKTLLTRLIHVRQLAVYPMPNGEYLGQYQIR